MSFFKFCTEPPKFLKRLCFGIVRLRGRSSSSKRTSTKRSVLDKKISNWSANFRKHNVAPFTSRQNLTSTRAPVVSKLCSEYRLHLPHPQSLKLNLFRVFGSKVSLWFKKEGRNERKHSVVPSFT